MSNRQERIVPNAAIDQAVTGRLLFYMADMLEAVDDGGTAHIDPIPYVIIPYRDAVYAWMLIAFMLADKYDVDPLDLRKLAHTIWKGSQDVIF